MSFEYKGRIIETDSNGFLLNKEDWNEEIMHVLADSENCDLTDKHILVINAVRKYYDTYATTPAIRILLKYLKESGYQDLASSIELAKLFPNGAAKSAAKYAGLPKPIKCI